MRTSGVITECVVSSKVHSNGTPLIIDSYFLRSEELGQVDLSVIIGKQIIIIECKSSSYISDKQKIRLLRSGITLSKILRLEVEFLLFSKEENIFYPVHQF